MSYERTPGVKQRARQDLHQVHFLMPRPIMDNLRVWCRANKISMSQFIHNAIYRAMVRLGIPVE